MPIKNLKIRFAISAIRPATVLAIVLFLLCPAQSAFADGSIVAWGWNNYGQCNIPEPNSGFIAIAAGADHSLGLKQDGSIVAWGWNNHGQCNIPSPNSGFVAVAAGCYHSLGLKQDGSILAWGDNYFGQCDVPSPNSGFIAIAAGFGNSLGLKQNGSIAAWGWIAFGQCNIPSPNSGFIGISTGRQPHSLGLKQDGSIVAWGFNVVGQCNVPSPNSGFIAIAAGFLHSLGLKQDGSILAWGDNYFGQCNIPSPNSGFIAIAAGADHSLGLKQDGSIMAWGNNNYGQCNIPSPNTGFVAVAAGDGHGLGLRGGQLATAFRILYSLPGRAGNVGPGLLDVMGSGFKVGATLKLVKGEIQLEPNEVTFCSIFKLSGIFDLTAAPIGTYDVVVTNPDSQSGTLPQAFEIVEGGQPHLWTKLSVPPQVRPGSSYTAYIEYGNEGEVVMPIPVLHISNSRGVPMHIGRYGRQSAIGLALLGIGPEGFRTELLPGSRALIPITFIAPQTGSVQFHLTAYLPDANPFPWDDLEALVRPTHLSDEIWDPEWSRLTGNMGSTWEEVVTQLRAVLEDLPDVDVELSADLVTLMTFALWAYAQPPDTNLYGETYLESQNLSSYSPDLIGDVYGNFDPVNDVQIIPDRYEPSNTCTYIITHGWRSSADNMEDLGQRIDGHCQSCNVLRVDWEKGAATMWFNPWGAADNIEPAGQEAYNKLKQRFGESFDWNKVTFIGHSFGNNVNRVISGLAGRQGRAIVLDPANHQGGAEPQFAKFYARGSVAVITDSLGDNNPCDPDPRRIADRQVHLNTFIGTGSHGEALRCFIEQIPTSNGCSQIELLWSRIMSLAAQPAGWYDGEINCDGQIVGPPFSPCPDDNDLPVPGDPVDSPRSTVIRPLDPSEKRGTKGYDPCETPPELCRHFVEPNTPLKYTIFFDNEPNATAPAQEVRILDCLNLALDWTTLELGEIAFGDQVVATLAGKVSGQDTVPLADSNYVVDITADFNPYTGRITWLLRTIDPVTGEPPEDPYAGFLPPNDPNHRGEGHVTFTIYPQKDLLDAHIPNKATIFFDTESPFDVNVWLNKVDGSPPTSAVSLLPALSVPSLFEVNWSGNDGQGCGIAAYDLYVSPNEEPYTPWILNTHNTSAVFSAAQGYTYRFYSVARDFLGNVEPAPGSPDAETVVGPIDFHVYALIGRHWGKDDCGPPLWCDGMDFDGNEAVDLEDVAIFAGNWLEGTTP